MAHHMPQGCFKLTVRMQRDHPSIPWGFRMQGGADFSNVPLSVQSVTPGSLADEVGLQPGDVITAVGDPPNPAINWTHPEAQQVIRQCIEYLVLTIQRGGTRMWEIGRSAGADLPQAQPAPLNQRNQAASAISSALPFDSKYMGGSAPSYGSNTNYSQPQDSFVQHSLAANKQDFNYAGTSHNRSAQPFNGAGRGVGHAGSPPITHNPYNSPMGLYSQDNASDAFNKQSTALLGGLNRGGSGTLSATQQAVQQVDQYGDFGGSFGQSAQNPGQGSSYQPNGGYQSQNSGGGSAVRSVRAPQTMGAEHYQQPTNQVPKCAACQSGIVGVFVRVRGQPMCVSCYKCARCGIPLKTIGHFIVEDQLYCEQHAKQLTRPGYDNYQSQTVYNR
ncbi:putative PDZ and LIM domain protein 3 [Hypsibius exemplaris]|uniref:PDZ and LIM domain protein 3 n=1 Tax=Hypsibius exemplaris TaxID=2072580 RepID=A0A1W0XBI0_HYPEX|nr:putative PDZ and LIM domain protein 3 [Hypsibius exemplaris]